MKTIFNAFQKPDSYKYLAVLIFIIITPNLFGQQLAQYSQYLHNNLILNPATAGVNDNLNLNISYRNQWSGFEDAPRTYYISVDGVLFKPQNRPKSLRLSRPGYTIVRKKFKKINHGLGGYLISDKYGAFRRNSGYLAYALHTSMGKIINVSLGVAMGASNLKLDQDKIELNSPGDATYDYYLQNLSKTYLDLNLGIWIYSDAFYVGYSSAQIVQNQNYSIEIPLEAKLNMHHFFTGGYKFNLHDDLTLAPSILLKFMRPAPISYDFNLKLNYRKMIWGGFSYRHNDAVIGLIGFTINNFVSIGYSYDFTLSNISNYTSGSHEIVFRIKFFKETSKSSISFL